ncbi:MAG TPA: hypothetical protein PLD75_03830 [Spirochaetota bacterium]|nr:hypothetical protein [Spirochaetota bacterium]
MKSILSKIFILLSLNLFAIETSLIDSVNIRKLFFYSENNWEKFVNTIRTYDNNTIGFICIRTIPREIESSTFEKIIGNIKDKDAIFLLDFYESNKNYYNLIEFIKSEDIKKIDSIFKSINFNDYDYVMYFYTLGENERQNFFGRVFYQFNYKKELIECRFYFQESSNAYLLFSKYKKNKFDVIFNGKKYRENLFYYFDFDSLRYLSRDAFLSLIRENKIDNEILVEKDDFYIKNKFIEKVISPSLNPNYNSDGARNEFGEYVLIKTEELQKDDKKGVNCSGFLKDIADNYIRLKHKDFKWMKISDLKRRRIENRVNEAYERYEEEYDPFFGLDWTKNIIDNINSYYNYNIIKCEELKNDKYAFYMENRGYYFDELKEILLRDQKKDSGYFYVIVFNRLRDTKPMIPTFYHIAILVPYFSNTRFDIRVFESGEETSFNKMIRRLIPSTFTIYKFEKEVLNRLEKNSDKKFMLYAFNKGKNTYYLRDDLSTNEIIKTRNILSQLDFNKEKVMIFKIPIPVVEILE